MKNKDTVYLIQLDESKVDFDWMKSFKYNKFAGRMVNQNGANLYFELEGTENYSLMIFPHTWIAWMAPITVEDPPTERTTTTTTTTNYPVKETAKRS